jgi:hypothetical protein
VGEDVDEVGITQLISTGPALITPALSVSRFCANNFFIARSAFLSARL